MTSEVTGTGIPGEHNAHMPQDEYASTGRRCSRGYCTFACTVGAARCRCPRCVDKEGAPTSRAVSKPHFTSNAFPGQGRSLVLDKPDTTACTHRTANAIPIRTSVNQNVIPRCDTPLVPVVTPRLSETSGVSQRGMVRGMVAGDGHSGDG